MLVVRAFPLPLVGHNKICDSVINNTNVINCEEYVTVMRVLQYTKSGDNQIIQQLTASVRANGVIGVNEGRATG
jgi:hypothetical protein